MISSEMPDLREKTKSIEGKIHEQAGGQSICICGRSPGKPPSSIQRVKHSGYYPKIKKYQRLLPEVESPDM